MFKRLALALLFLAWLQTDARAAISAPVYLGSASDATNTVTSIGITTGTNASAGCLLGVVIIGSATISNTPVVTDTASNTYTFTAVRTWNTSSRMFLAYSRNPAALNSGGTITVAWSGGGSRVATSAVSICGLDHTSPLDIDGAGTAGTGTSDSIATGTLSQAAEVIIAVTGLANTSVGYTPGGSFTSLTAPTQGNTSTLLWSYEIVAATTTVTYAPAWTTSRAFGSNVITFKDPSGGSTSHNLGLMGVGR